MAARARSIGRPLSMTPLIDVIFLLLLFFMLTSTFTRFSEIELPLSGGAAASDPSGTLIFLRASETELLLNGQEVSFESLKASLAAAPAETSKTLIVSATQEATTQRLVDILASIRGVPDVSVSFLGGTR